MKRFLEFINENKNTMRLYYSDKLRTLFTKISNGNSEEAKKIANFLILAEDSNQMEDKYTLVDVTEKNDYVSYIQVNRILKDFPDKDNRVENDSKFWTDEKIRTKHKIGKWVTHIYKDVYKTQFTPSQIEEFSNAYKATYDAIDIAPEFVILKGDDIKWGYLESNYAEGKSTLANSCMRYDYCQKYFDIYTENEEVCSLLVLKSSDNKVKGRALLWVLDDGELYMDRIYIANDSDKYLFDEWAEEKNYRTYLNDYKSKSVDVEENSYDYYPYMDTFVAFDTNNGVLKSSDDGDCIKLQSTTGGYEEPGVWSDYAQEHIDEDYAVWIESIDDYVHQDDAVYLSYQDTYEIDDASYRSRRNLPALVHSECCETWLYVDDSSYSEILKDYVDISDGDYTTFIINKDEDEDIVPDGVKYTHLYKEVNDKNYSVDYIQNPYTGEYGFWDDIIYDVRNELVSEFGEDSTKVHGELVEKLLEFDKEEKEIPDEDFLTNIRENGMYNTILRTYYGFQSKPTEVEMLPAIYMGALLKIESEDTIPYWPEDKYKNKLDYILNLIDDEELTNSYTTWTKSNSMMKDIIRFAYGFDYTIFNEDIYKRVLYNRIFS
jgi:hypothetical protein